MPSRNSISGKHPNQHDKNNLADYLYMQSINRIESLDYLRGAMALAVMIYHYTVWSGIEITSDSTLSKLGIYAVSIFYILSGLTLTLIYKGKIQNKNDAYRFYIKRAFRIVPLFWLTVASMIALKAVKSILTTEQFELDPYQVFLNITLLFSFLDPGAYMSTGAWSIGNEVFFYTLFPFIIILASKSRVALTSIILISALMGLYFSCKLIDDSKDLVSQWSYYINPINQIFLFCSGIAIGYRAGTKDKRKSIALIIMSILVFFFTPAIGDRVLLVTDGTRAVLSIACIFLVYGIYTLKVKINGPGGKALCFLGETCYSIYLLHPIIAIPLVFLAEKVGLNLISAYLASTIITLIISHFTYTYIEKPMMRTGCLVAARVGTQ